MLLVRQAIALLCKSVLELSVSVTIVVGFDLVAASSCTLRLNRPTASGSVRQRYTSLSVWHSSSDCHSGHQLINASSPAQAVQQPRDAGHRPQEPSDVCWGGRRAIIRSLHIGPACVMAGRGRPKAPPDCSRHGQGVTTPVRRVSRRAQGLRRPSSDARLRGAWSRTGHLCYR
ncbi:hypothetical protein C2E23DRAFT_800848 [Lenzites betulinus]|nr:hypothetical protein C2E23DRAFT_800848 [Lenzites betulinus]